MSGFLEKIIHPVWLGIWIKWKSYVEKCGGVRDKWNFFLGLKRRREFWEMKSCSIFNKGRIKIGSWPQSGKIWDMEKTNGGTKLIYGSWKRSLRNVDNSKSGKKSGN